MRVLGISAFYHDSAAALVADGKILAAAQEERFTRIKHDSSFPKNSMRFCLDRAGLRLKDLDAVVFYDKPLLKFERLLETHFAFAPTGLKSFALSMPVWLKDKLFFKRMLRDDLTELEGWDFPAERLLFSEHHLSHAASAFYPSPFDRAAILTLDGVGEWCTSSIAIGEGNTITMNREIHFPHSIGLLYSAFTQYTGFKVNSGEYKLMGLAPYGVPRFKEKILKHLIDLKDDGSFWLDMNYFGYGTEDQMINRRFEELFGSKARTPDEPMEQIHMDLAASIQAVTDEAVLKMTRAIQKDTGISNLCMAGGVALNCVTNGKVLRDGKFKNIWIQPAAGDAGCALGAALAASHLHFNQPRKITSSKDSMQGSYLGPDFAQSEIEERLKKAGAKFHVLAQSELIQKCAEGMESGKALGWFQGRMEFGPRALGGRSIVADPRSEKMQSLLNLKVKYRESFRPFAPSVLSEDVSDWFELESDSPYMLIVADVAKKRRKALSEESAQLTGLKKLSIPRSEIPAVTHVDLSARIQTVHQETNPAYHALISEFKRRTGCAVLVNTSFNVRGEPIVCTPEDAFRCFMGTEIELLAIGNCLLFKEEQTRSSKDSSHRDQFLPD